MSAKNEIKSEKIFVQNIFDNMWFCIPVYQRPYIWGKDEINDLLDDLLFALRNKPEQEYFIGSFVFQEKKVSLANGQFFIDQDLLDGQQRMTTLLMIFACVRDITQDLQVKAKCEESIFQKGDDIDDIPERTRIYFSISDDVQAFVDEYLKQSGGTNREADLKYVQIKANHPTTRNMAKAILEIRKFLETNIDTLDLKQFIKFVRNNVLFIFVATENLDDAFRLFTILNDRGVPLRNSDILKAQNLGALNDDTEKEKYSKLWAEAEGRLGEDFDRFLNHLRTILVKDKARLSLLDEFEQKIYLPTERDKNTNQIKPPLLSKGIDTFKFIERYLNFYTIIFELDNYGQVGNSYEFDNLVKVMLVGLPSTDWIPPLLRYFDKFKHENILPFLKELDNKFSSDWISQYTPTTRIENMIEVINVIEKTNASDDVLKNKCFEIDTDAFQRAIESTVYGRRFTRYLLLKIDFILHDHSQLFNIESPSVEHILPQNPADDSMWVNDFTEKQRLEWTDMLGNLVLITRKKNSSQGRRDYQYKRNRYFENRISNCPNSLRVLRKYSQWTPAELEENHQTVLKYIKDYYAID